MNWLVRLKTLDHTPAAPLQNQKNQPFAGFAGAGPALSQKTEGEKDASAATPDDPADEAVPAADLFTARQALFTDRGLHYSDAVNWAGKLAERDRDLDERQLCLECQHLSGGVNARRCSQWKKLGIASAAIPGDLVTILQRCVQFNQRLKVIT